MADEPKACPACGGGHVIRSGHACGRQRWRCKGCGRQFTRTTPRGKPAAMKAEAVALYCTGLSLNAIGEKLGVSAQSVMRWVRDHARERCPKPEPTGDTAVVELDEVWHFVQKNRQTLDLESVRARRGPADRLGVRRPRRGYLEAPAGPPGAVARTPVLHRLFCTDDWAPYDMALPVGRHYIGKDQTHRSESNHARQRHWFARFRRRTCVVSKSVAMVEATMALFAFYHCNSGQLTPASVG